ncbi:hypothetical protein HPC38_00035 [Pasteurellaceae bacterium HPA106]|uniref:hypothetical protein n=1 Tax=Spirabiliibacterium pneumoniae TaxID=221400 RepID=UPI001AAC5654|nr:hypothetical protein [Spirabiliibacterium pneumoniae]MBE2895273.1 hypothetical protein [Spirabiliibacterium pneumoniae]
MSQQSEHKTALLFFSLAPIAELVTFEALFYGLRVTYADSRFFALFSAAVLSAQAILHLVFFKGEICPGQRGRLSNVAMYFAIYWVLVLVACVHKPFVPQSWQALAGLLLTFSAFRQPKEPQLRKAILLFGGIAGSLGLVCYALLLYRVSGPMWLMLSPFNQLLIACILTYYALQLARSRLANFIQLLPWAMLLMLVCNVIFALVVLTTFYWQEQVLALNVGLSALYFALHLLLAGLIIRAILRQRAAGKMQSAVWLGISLALPLVFIWANL